MSFNNNYEAFQGQPTADPAGAPGGNGPPAQQPELGQAMETAPTGFSGPHMAAPGAPPPQQGGDKTTLW
jgi:hypothetical protein